MRPLVTLANIGLLASPQHLRTSDCVTAAPGTSNQTSRVPNQQVVSAGRKTRMAGHVDSTSADARRTKPHNGRCRVIVPLQSDVDSTMAGVELLQ